MFDFLGLLVASPLLEAGHPHIAPLASPPLQAGGGKFSQFSFLLFFRRDCLVSQLESLFISSLFQEELFGRLVTDLESLWCSD